MATLSEHYVAVCKLTEVPQRGKKTVHLDELTVLLVACENGLYAVEDRCPQTGRSIGHGKVINGVITAPTTGARYHLQTGEYVGSGLTPFPSNRLMVFPVQVIDGVVYIRLPQR